MESQKKHMKYLLISFRGRVQVQVYHNLTDMRRNVLLFPHPNFLGGLTQMAPFPNEIMLEMSFTLIQTWFEDLTQ